MPAIIGYPALSGKQSHRAGVLMGGAVVRLCARGFNRNYDSNGQPVKGEYARVFDEVPFDNNAAERLVRPVWQTSTLNARNPVAVWRKAFTPGLSRDLNIFDLG